MSIPKKKFFNKINFNKRWDEEDWEHYFLAQDQYRLSALKGVGPKPISKFIFEGSDEVVAFEPVLRAYGGDRGPTVVEEVRGLPFKGDGNPEADYNPSTDEDPHYWREGVPLGSFLIYRDCCRFAICTSLEIDRYLKKKESSYRKKYSGEFEALRFHANWIAINIAHGHKLGYSTERVRGNITKCRRAIKHADMCVALIGRISTRTQSKRLRHELFGFAVQLRNALFSWIDELRLQT